MDLNIFRKLSVKAYLLIVFIVVSTAPVIMLSLIQYEFIDNNILSVMEGNNLSPVKILAGKIKLYLDFNSKAIQLSSSQIYSKEPD